MILKGMGFNGKRSGPDYDNKTESVAGGAPGSSKLMVGMVDKRKPGMEFLGKR